MTPLDLDPQLLNNVRHQLSLGDLQILVFAIERASDEMRRSLRQELLHLWPQVTDSPQMWMNLSLLPKPTCGDVSLTHSPPLALAVYTAQDCLLGIDCEPKGRVKLPTIERVASTRELEEMSSAGHLWVAKEAAFKALAKACGTKLMSMVEISHWTLHDQKNDTWTCRAALPQSGHKVSAEGVVMPIKDCIFSIFKTDLNFPPGTPIGT